MQSDPDARVAVIIPVYRALFLADALDSVFAQSHPAHQVIVVDDGSPDQDALAHAIQPYGDRITLLRQPNRGAGAARNAGLRAADAEFIGLLDADDGWLPGLLSQQLAILAAAPQLDLIYGDALLVGRSPLAGRTFMAACPSVPDVTFERLLSQECTVLLSTVVMRRAAIEAVGGFDESLRRGQDFDLWLRMARAGARLTSRRAVLARRRVHDDNLSGNAVTELERPLRVFEKVLKTMPLNKRELAIVETRVQALAAGLARERGKQLLERGDFTAARLAFDEARRGLQAWKLHATAIGLRIAPQLVRWLYLSRLTSSPNWAR